MRKTLIDRLNENRPVIEPFDLRTARVRTQMTKKERKAERRGKWKRD